MLSTGEKIEALESGKKEVTGGDLVAAIERRTKEEAMGDSDDDDR